MKAASGKSRKRRIFLTLTIIIELIAVVFIGVRIFYIAQANMKAAAAAEAKAKIVAEKKADAKAIRNMYADSSSPMIRTAYEYVGNKGGKKFWSWYGYSYHVAWCGCFVSYCADQNGYLGTKVPKFSFVPEGVNWFMAKDSFKYPSGYTPEPGDVIFFRSKGSKSTSASAGAHVGLVAGSYKGRVYTIEGNHLDTCAQRSYSLKDQIILGYGTIDE